jgi:hypothetical protein
MSATGIPLASCADQTLAKLAAVTNSAAISKLDGQTLLGERAMLGGMAIPGRTSAGGGCRLFDAVNDTIALNLARAVDRELLPALFETDELNCQDDEAIADRIARSDATALVLRGRSMGLAIASAHETSAPAANACAANTRLAHAPAANAWAANARLAHAPAANAWATNACVAAACVEMVAGPAALKLARDAPRVVDLSGLWAGPLAAHLLWLAGADVVKVESRTRPDGMRANEDFYALLNQGKASVALDFADTNDRQRLLSLIAASDIVIEAARPRALAQLGIDAAQIVRTTPGLVWLTITAHGAVGEAANWVGFGDDCAVSGGLSAALSAACGQTGFVGDAIADPLTGLCAALVAWQTWAARRGGRFGLSMSQVVAESLATAARQDTGALNSVLTAWSSAAGQPFPTVSRRPIGAVPAFGEHTWDYMPNHRGARR